MAAEAGAPGAAPGRPAPREGCEPDGILVVDDDPETLRHVRDALAEAGYAPLVIGDHGELARIIRAEKPALVLFDLMLPGTDGVELMQTVPELADTPVIFISGCGRDETVARALEGGAEDYIVKPFSPTELTARVQAALRRRSNPAPFGGTGSAQGGNADRGHQGRGGAGSRQRGVALGQGTHAGGAGGTNSVNPRTRAGRLSM